MNQDQVKDKLLELDSEVEAFAVTFSGKSSKKVDGLYKPDTREIIIHNKNFADDNGIMYTAIHEFAHHIQFTKSPVPVSSRAHTSHFWETFHKLLYLAEEKSIYTNVFKKNSEFLELTQIIKDSFLSVNGQMMIDFGTYLFRAFELCKKYNVSFEDYADRELGLHRNAAKKIIKISSMNMNPEVGFENMKTLSSIKDDAVRKDAESALLEGKSPDYVRAQFAEKEKPDNKLDYLMMERDRLEHSLDTLTRKLAKIERDIQDLKHKQ